MDLAVILISLGTLFVAGLAADQVGHQTRLPRVTLLLGCGIIAGGAGFDVIPTEVEAWYEFLSIVALTMVAFLLGGSLTTKNLRKHGKPIVAISVSIVLATLAIVSVGLWLLGMDIKIALLLGAIATATDPAATQDVIRQSGAKGAFPKTLKGIVAIDDAWGLIAFSLIVVVVHQLNGSGDAEILSGVARELGGSILLGAVIGFPAAYLTGRLTGGEPLQIEALALVFLTAGFSIWLELSYLISGMTVGVIIVNRARHHKRAFHEIEHIQWPFMILFFILAGASLEPAILIKIGWIGVAYVVFRCVSRIVGGWFGAQVAGVPKSERPWYGAALMPQAGVAVGMALVASKQFPDWAETIMALTIGTTVFFEVLGPAATSFAIGRVNTARGQDLKDSEAT
ncbi:cation:proton antiporter [Pseudohalocynthiibacter aestuariivivens]|jgi:NhaP-type Na+/H+ or K+/H+ antiporter|uniref:Cation:proton antiporter n=1 Tax=Pseudohalocynthiibacter aestuariivivens TaxID=1591409 RepID=A0ABV5JAF9_9RHOB|nr:MULTISPECIES: cation:proton antiporter [Pseudohalocynthiibacter]MBS9716013.1 cation:proton antiporter [Pseudohalocynthiibacter aestuariivivens]MCK0102430.1 cation:proton antiporter [Pseudohalocynthiibacter sp. F2068]